MPQNDIELNPTKMTLTTDKAMPQDPEAEESVLSAMLLSPDALTECSALLRPQDFYIPSNRKIFEAIVDMASKGLTVEPISLADYLKTKGELEAVGGRARLSTLTRDLLAISAWPHHVEMLQRDTTLRELITASAKITALAFDAPEDTKEVVNQAEQVLLAATDREISSGYERIETIMDNFYDELNDLARSGGTRQGIKTCYPGIDEKIIGMRPGQMIVIGARPSIGKTAFALNLVVNAAKKEGASVALFSLEMTKTEIAERLLAMQQGVVSLSDIRGANITPDKWPPIIQASNTLSELDIMIDDSSNITMTEIRAKARRMLRNKEKGLIVIDYLQLISPTPGRRSDSRATEVSEMSRGVKIMAKELGVPVIALSQLNRGTENRTGSTSKRPQLSDLRESGSIEQDADIVILLDRSTTKEEAENGKNRPEWGITEFIIAKNRSGPTGQVDLSFIGKSTKFVERTKRYDN